MEDLHKTGINEPNGFNTVKVAVQGTDKRWHLKCEHRSAQYSTNLSENQGQSLNSILLPSKKERLVRQAKWFTLFLVVYIQDSNKTYFLKPFRKM